jgi:hypothetical protein
MIDICTAKRKPQQQLDTQYWTTTFFTRKCISSLLLFSTTTWTTTYNDGMGTTMDSTGARNLSLAPAEVPGLLFSRWLRAGFGRARVSDGVLDATSPGFTAFLRPLEKCQMPLFLCAVCMALDGMRFAERFIVLSDRAAAGFLSSLFISWAFHIFLFLGLCSYGSCTVFLCRPSLLVGPLLRMCIMVGIFDVMPGGRCVRRVWKGHVAYLFFSSDIRRICYGASFL